MDSHKDEHTKGKGKKHPYQRLPTPAEILNLPFSGEQNESEVTPSVILTVGE
jgi:hypothetical protein